MKFRSSKSRYSIKPDASENLADNPVGSRAKGLELDLHLREFEINQLTQRNNFFMIFQGVLIAGLVQSQGTAAPIITFSMCLLGTATSVLQIGMAGGAKYWQSRWEASTRSSEIAIVLELAKKGKLAVQTFTHNSKVLTKSEQELIKKWNDTCSKDDAVIDDPDLIDEIVSKDINSSHKCFVRRWADWWVRECAIKPKWSVSRIPIWIGAALFIFWVNITLHTVSIPGHSVEVPDWWPLKLVPLKVEPAATK